MPRPITEHFARVLKAPLCNPMWSWGAVRDDGAVFLRCWDDEIKKGVALLGSSYDHGHNGGVERRKHIKLIEAGATGYVVVLTAVDKNASPRSIEAYNPDCVFLLDDIQHHDDDTITGRMKQRVAIGDIA